MFLVYYRDDEKRKHICVAKDYAEVKFLNNRFGIEKLETISDKIAKAIIPSAKNRI